MFGINKGYICCGCSERNSKKTARAVYKNSCICNNCYSKFDILGKTFVFQGTKETEFALMPFAYEETYRKIFLSFKFNGEYAAGHLIGMLLEEYFSDVESVNDFDYIVPVPISKQRLLERGYNQTEILAEYISRAIGVPMNKSLIRTKHTAAQSTLLGLSRVENVKGAFETVQSFKRKSILLFDDIITTGSTINECARVLKAAGADRIVAVCSAYVKISELRNY